MLRFLTSIANVVEWIVIAFALLAVTGLLEPAGAQNLPSPFGRGAGGEGMDPTTPPACDCAHFAYEALKRINVKLKTVPAVVGTTQTASYARGVARIGPSAPCSVWIHEFAHHDQWLHGLEAARQYDARWWALEHNAKALEKRALEYGGTCDATH